LETGLNAAPESHDSGEPLGASARAGVLGEAVRLLRLAVARARNALLWELVWPALTTIAAVAGLFVALSWTGFWVAITPTWRIAGLVLFALVLIASLVPAVRVRLPSRGDALRRLDRRSGLQHRPATTIDDKLAIGGEDPVIGALWRAHVERTAAAARTLRAGWPRPRLVERDPYALRALVVLALVATFFMAEGERWKRIATAFDFSGAIVPKLYRVDAWVTPPLYTGRPPLLLPGVRHDEPAPRDIAALQVPAGSIVVVRATGLSAIDLATDGGLAEEPNETPKAAAGAIERHYKITTDGALAVRGLPAGAVRWAFRAVPDHAPTIALAKDPEVLGRASLSLTYKLEDDYGVVNAEAKFTRPPAKDGKPAPRPLVEAPDFALVLPHARTRSAVGQTNKDLTEHPWAGTKVSMALVARDEAGNEGRSEARDLVLPARPFVKPLAKALVELRRMLALDANERERVRGALDALMLAPERFSLDPSIYLGLRTAATRIRLSRTDDDLRSVVDYLWEIAVLLEDGTMSDAERDLRAAEEALRQALDRGATDEEIRKLTENLRQALDRFLQALAEQMRRDGTTDARPLDRNARLLRPQDLKNMLDRIEQLARSGARDAARRLLDEMQAMLENLQRGRQARGDPMTGEMNEMLDQLGRMIQDQQRLRDRTFREGRDSRSERRRSPSAERSERDRQAFRDLQRNQEALRQQLQRMLEQLRRQRERGDQTEPGPGEEPGDALGRAEQAMRDAEGALSEGEGDPAVDAQGRALENLRRGAQSLADRMQGPGDGPGDAFGPSPEAAQRTDPLGRPVRSREYSDDYTVKVPDEIDVQRARRVLEELRKRLGEPARPRQELDYIERLLQDF
jgi:uncharacterized protein (TIGR02302 family)